MWQGRFCRAGGGGSELGGGAVQGGGWAKLDLSATRLNSEEAHKVTHGHNAHYSEDTTTKEDTIIVETSQSPYHKLK